MNVVPVTGAAVFSATLPPRNSTIRFTDGEREVSMRMRGALPFLNRVYDEVVHPSIGLLTAGTRLAVQIMRAGAVERVEGHELGAFHRAVVEGPDAERVRLLAEARAYEGMSPREGEAMLRGLIDGVVDATAEAGPVPEPRRVVAWAVPGPDTAAPAVLPTPSIRERLRLRAGYANDRTVATGAAEDVGDVIGTSADGLPVGVNLSFRVEADDGTLATGRLRLVAQVHDRANALHVVDAVDLWSGSSHRHGFGEGATHNALVVLQIAAAAWPPAARFLDPAESGVPDRIELDAAEIAGLLEQGVERLADAGIEVMWPRELGRDLSARPVLDSAPGREFSFEERLFEGLFSAESVFSFRWRLAIGDEPLTEEEMDALAKAASPVVKLRGSWRVVHPSIAKKARHRVLKQLGAAQVLAAALTGDVAAAGVDVDDLRDSDLIDEPVIGASILRLREAVLASLEVEHIAMPDGLTARLRDYQKHGVSWLARLTGLGLGGVLADDMGLGKTVQLIALHLHRQQRGHRAPTLVVCPTSLLGNWAAEIAKFAPGSPVTRFHGAARELAGFAADDTADPGFVLTTYGTMRRDIETLREVGWGLVIADEAQHVKNAATTTARALRQLGGPDHGGGIRVALTGTPVENNLTELWAILDWCVPGLLGSRQAFRRVWAAPIESGAAGAAKTAARTAEFAELIAPFLLRRRKSDPGIAPELPPKTETDHLLTLTREQAVLYEAFVRDTMQRIERATEEDGSEVARRGLVLQLLTGLKQICNHPAHFLKQAAGSLDGRSEKLDLLDELVDTIRAEDGGVLIFTQFVEMARLLERHWAEHGVPHQFLHGSTSVTARERMVERFQAGEVPVFLLSLQAGGTGLNLTRADHVIHFDRWWNPAVEDQATDRAHRIGQTKPVQVHRFITRGTVEERIDELLAQKRTLADAVLGSGEPALTELSNAELRDLVELRKVEA